MDEIILNILTAKNSSGFNQILVGIKQAGIPIVKRKLSSHLQRLSDRGFILRDDPLPGKTRLCRLHPNVIIEREWDVFEGVKGRGRQTNQIESRQAKNKRLIKLLFAIAATGSFRFVPKSIGIDTIQEVVFEPGVSENDIIRKMSPPYLIETKFVGDFTTIEVNYYLRKLREQDIIKPISESNGETRFGFCDSRVHDFVFDWNILLDTILTNMRDNWILLNKKTTTQEKNWYLSIFTKHESNNFFTSVALKKLQHYKTLDDFCKKHDPVLQNAIMKATKREYKDRIEETNLRIKDQVKVLEKKYADIKEKHSVIYNLVRKMIYPPFLAN